MAKNDELQEDKKYISIVIGGSLLISFATILGGRLLEGTNLRGLTAFGYGIEVLGWFWVVGTVAAALYLQARMRNLRAQYVRAEK